MEGLGRVGGRVGEDIGEYGDVDEGESTAWTAVGRGLERVESV